MKLAVKKIMFITMIGMCIVGCEKNEKIDATTQNQKNKQENEKSNWIFSIRETNNIVNSTYENSHFELNYIGDFSNKNKINTSLEIIDKNLRQVILSIQFTEDIVRTNYKLYTRNNLVSTADRLLNDNAINSSEFDFLTRATDDFIEELKSRSNGNYFYDFRYKGFNFPYSIMKMMNRAVQTNKNNCSCRTPGVYFEDNAAFMCTQDIILKTDVVESFYNNLDTVVFKDSIIGVEPMLLVELSKVNSTYITYEELAQIISLLPDGSSGEDPTSLAFLGLCGLFGVQGSDIGCCANYSGPCWYCHVVCFTHDLLCVCCNSNVVPCFSGCNPEDGC